MVVTKNFTNGNRKTVFNVLLIAAESAHPLNYFLSGHPALSQAYQQRNGRGAKIGKESRHEHLNASSVRGKGIHVVREVISQHIWS